MVGSSGSIQYTSSPRVESGQAERREGARSAQVYGHFIQTAELKVGALSGQATLSGWSASVSIREGRTTVFEKPDEVKPALVGVALSGESATVMPPKQSVAAVLLRLAELRPDTGAACPSRGIFHSRVAPGEYSRT